MAKETQIGQLVIDLKIKAEGLEKGLEAAKKKIQEVEQQNKHLKNSNSEVDASFIAMSVGVVASVKKITSAVEEGVNKYNSYVNGMNALNKTAKATNNSMEDIKSTINDVNKLKLMDDSDVTTATKNLLTYGFTVEQTGDILKVLQDAAVGNRQANYSLSEAVRVTTEGIRMENSVLSDAAGVQKNISKMYEEYAQSLGKSTDSLTQAEKAQAVYNGIMNEAAMFTGSAAEMAEGYQGQQAQLNATNLELSRTIGESMIPVLTQYSSLQLSIKKNLTEFISNHKGATSGLITFATVLLIATAGLIAIKTAINAYKKAVATATIATTAFKVTLGSIFAISAVIGIITAITTALGEQEEATARVRAEQELYNQVMDKSVEVTDENIDTVKEMIAELEGYKNAILKAEEAYKSLNSTTDTAIEKAYKLITAADDISAAFASAGIAKNVFGIDSMEKLEDSIESCKKEEEKYNQIKEVSNNIDLESARNKKKEAAQAVETAKEYQRLFNIYKTGQKGTEEYEKAVETLSKAFPEAVSATGILDKEMQAFIENSASNAELSWNNAQLTIDEKIQAIEQTIANCSPEVDPNGTFRASLAEKIGVPADEVIGKLQGLITLFDTLKGADSSQIGGVSVPKTTTRSGNSSYSNKALDNYKKEIAHKKAMDQISLQQEIQMYETALKKYAKTTDEKRELREKIYELNKELAQKEKDILDQQTEDYEAYIQEQKNLRGFAYDVTQQTNDYNKIIQMHKNYLNQIMKDERLSLDERKEIYREELQTIRDYEQQKRDLRVEHIDNTVSQLTNAITKQLEEMQEKDKEMIDKNLEQVEKWKNARIEAINAEYDTRIEAIEKELQALDKAEQQKSRDEEDAEYERKKKRLEDLVAYEHDAVTKANYQKELDKLIAEYQKTLEQRELEDKKEALNAQKELLKEEQDNKTQAIEDEADKKKEVYDKQLNDLEKYYEEQMNKAQETAENMLLNMEQNQDKILNLLQSYGNAYEITGQSLGEKLAQGINEGLASKIENIIARIQNSIDAGIEAQIAKMASSVYRYEAGANKPQTTSVSTTQNIYIEQNPEMPSETYRKLRNINEELAADLAGM